MTVTALLAKLAPDGDVAALQARLAELAEAGLVARV
jgi:hypothetical protein